MAAYRKFIDITETNFRASVPPKPPKVPKVKPPQQIEAGILGGLGALGAPDVELQNAALAHHVNWVEMPAANKADDTDLAFLPKYIVTGLDRLQASSPLWDVSTEQWAAIVASARGIALQWGQQALGLGWRDIDLFGLHPRAPWARHDCRGLAFSIFPPPTRIAAITASAATIERLGGSTLKFYRRTDDTEALLAWSLCGIGGDP